MPGVARQRHAAGAAQSRPQDVIIEIDNKSLTHRPDLWGHYAFARELAADLRPAAASRCRWSIWPQYDRLPAYPLAVEDFEGCPCYGCIEFRVRGRGRRRRW